MSLPDLHRSVLDNLSDGVLAVGTGGRIEMFNPAAERILGIAPGEAHGNAFAELFIAREGFDEFTSLIIDATLRHGGDERRVVQVQRDGETRSLSVATSYLRRAPRGADPDGGAGADPGDAPAVAAVIAVFSDISDIRELRENELRMAQAAQAQHERLHDAYRVIEERNAALAAALRKVRVVQGLGMVLVIGLFLGVGAWAWRPLDLFERVGLTAQATVRDAGEQERRLTVTPRNASTSMSLRGRLEPWRAVAVRNDVNATVAAVHYASGEPVTEGQLLLELDLSKVRDRHRQQLKRLAELRKKYDKLVHWEDGREMTQARRRFTRATLEMEGRRNRMKKSIFLFERGLVAAAEHEDALRQHESQELDYQAAKEEFEEASTRVGEEEIATARANVEAARAELQAIEDALGRDHVVAPLSGVVLTPGRGARELTAGASVREGEVLLAIGDLSRFVARSQVDEADIGKLALGQAVTVTGNAFRGLRLAGEVTHVAATADPRARGIPKFDVTVTLDPLGPEEAARVRSGMSGQLRIVTYSNPEALLVPIDAVESRGGKHRLRVLDPASGEARERIVEIGPTTRDSVEVRAGLEAGETILLPRG